MPLKNYLLAVLLMASCSGCFPPVQRTAPPPASKKAAALSPEDEKKAERLYYQAVGAYSNGDMKAASAYLDQISGIHPSYRPAAELREKIKKIGGR